MSASQPDRDVGLLAARRDRTDSPDLGPKTADIQSGLPAQRHARANRVSDRDGRFWQTAKGAADYPVELVGHPSRPRGIPDGQHPPAGGDHALVLVRSQESREPARVGLRVIVQEGRDLAGGSVQPSVSATREALYACVLHDPNAGQLKLCTGEQFGVVVHDQDHLAGRRHLLCCGTQSVSQPNPSVERVCAHDHRHISGHRECLKRSPCGIAALRGQRNHRLRRRTADRSTVCKKRMIR